MTEKETIKIALTGHRPKYLPGGYNIYSPENLAIATKLREILLSHLNDGKQVHAISGMALGCDTIFARVAMKLKKQGYDVFLEAAIPCIKQAKKWPKASQDEYDDILLFADKVTYVSTEEYRAELMQRRDEYMVDQADELIGVWSGIKSGTYNTLVYAKEKGVPITLIHPNELLIAINGNLLDSDCDILMHQCNCHSTFGAGIAAQIKKRYPAVFAADQNYPLDATHRFGFYSSAYVHNHLGRPIEVVNLYGQMNYGHGKRQTDYAKLKSALFMYLSKAHESGMLLGKKIGVPMFMGCGLAGGDWNEVKKILEEAVKTFHISIYTYKYEEKRSSHAG